MKKILYTFLALLSSSAFATSVRDVNVPLGDGSMQPNELKVSLSLLKPTVSY